MPTTTRCSVSPVGETAHTLGELLVFRMDPKFSLDAIHDYIQIQFFQLWSKGYKLGGEAQQNLSNEMPLQHFICICFICTHHIKGWAHFEPGSQTPPTHPSHLHAIIFVFYLSHQQDVKVSDEPELAL